jgi:REP element-mobilizing transposase RayT
MVEGEATIVFVTVCTKNRGRWLATHELHQLLRQVWTEASAWRTGRYILLPDHLHLFASPGEPEGISLENWIKYWESQFRKKHKQPQFKFQTDHWDTRLRSNESYEEKWEYVRNNAVRHGLVQRAEDWPFHGEIFELRWD